jgi:translation initiation factor RLI1
LYWIVGIIIAVGLIVIAILVAVFGSLREAVKVLTNGKEQKKFLREIDGAFHRNVNRDKPKLKAKKPPKDKEQKSEGEDNERSAKSG